jgi:putative SbcD/Mre11-related phosphoesterase
MRVSDFQPITDYPALYIKNDKILVIADLHIGIEKQLYDLGINAFSQSVLMKDKLISICKKYNPNKIILLGDVKHNIPASTFQERENVTTFLENLQKYSEIHIIPGNHDGNIKKISPKEIIIHPSDGFLYKNIGFIHGHRWPRSEIMDCRYLILGHTHPTIMLEDGLGYKHIKPCWLKGEIEQKLLIDRYENARKIKFIVVPAFNSLCGGIPVNVDGLVGPIQNIIDLNNIEIYLLNGSSLGKIKELDRN